MNKGDTIRIHKIIEASPLWSASNAHARPQKLEGESGPLVFRVRGWTPTEYASVLDPLAAAGYKAKTRTRLRDRAVFLLVEKAQQ